MKKTVKNLLVLSLIGMSITLSSCTKAEAKPTNVDDKIVDFSDTTESYFKNTYDTLYQSYIDSGSSNSKILENLINIIAETELPKFFGSEAAFKAEFDRLCKKELVDKVKNGGYNTDYLFQEEKLVKELRSSLYDVKLPEGKNYNNNYLILPDTTEKDFNEVFNADYTDYFNKSLKSTIYKKLLTAKYMCEEQFSTLGRAQARDVSYIKIDKISDNPNAVSLLIADWLSQYTLGEKKANSKFDLESLARIWKGVSLESVEEETFANSHYNLNKQLEERIEKVAVSTPIGYEYNQNLINPDSSIEDEFTNSGAYSLNWGFTLKQRELAQKDFTGSDLYTKSENISDLPSSITDRIFSVSVEKYIENVTYKVGTDEYTIGFLTPSTTENTTDTLSKYYHYDLNSNAYYIVVINNYNFTYSSLQKEVTEVDGVKSYSKNVINIAEQLASSTSNQREAVIKYMEKYDISKNIHDQAFYDYLKTNYSELFESKK